MTSPDAHPSVYEAGRRAARAKLRDLVGELMGAAVAEQIADAVLDQVLPLIAANRIATPSAEGYGDAVHWTVYSAMLQRALHAEYALEDALKETPAPADGS